MSWFTACNPACRSAHASYSLLAGDFKDYRLKVHGLVENPVALSLDEKISRTRALLREAEEKGDRMAASMIRLWLGDMKKAAEKLEKDYKAALDRIPNKAYDPWASVRDAPKAK
jgi:hypothetical protein